MRISSVAYKKIKKSAHADSDPLLHCTMIGSPACWDGNAHLFRHNSRHHRSTVKRTASALPVVMMMRWRQFGRAILQLRAVEGKGRASRRSDEQYQPCLLVSAQINNWK